MQKINQSEFNEIIQIADIKPKLKRGLKYVSSVEKIRDDWDNYEFVAIYDKTEQKGVLLLQPDADLYIVDYEINRRIVDSTTGRDRAVVCDLCYTWQTGSNAASVTFTHATTKNTVRWLCCGDLKCSDHVRTLTKASILSRSQLRENMTNDKRVARLKSKLLNIIEQLELHPI